MSALRCRVGLRENDCNLPVRGGGSACPPPRCTAHWSPDVFFLIHTLSADRPFGRRSASNRELSRAMKLPMQTCSLQRSGFAAMSIALALSQFWLRNEFMRSEFSSTRRSVLTNKLQVTWSVLGVGALALGRVEGDGA